MWLSAYMEEHRHISFLAGMKDYMNICGNGIFNVYLYCL